MMEDQQFHNYSFFFANSLPYPLVAVVLIVLVSLRLRSGLLRVFLYKSIPCALSAKLTISKFLPASEVGVVPAPSTEFSTNNTPANECLCHPTNHVQVGDLIFSLGVETEMAIPHIYSNSEC